MPYLRPAALLLTGWVIAWHPLLAATHYVGSCHASGFPSITAAILSPTVVAGDTINVCAGVYYEQVIISKSLTLKGVPVGNESAAEIALTPSTRLQQTTSAVLGALISPLVWITTGPVYIQNIRPLNNLNPSPLNCPNSAQTPAFFFQAGSSGTLNHVLADRGYCGPAVWAEGTENTPSSVTITNSYVYGILAASQQPTGTIPSLAITITGNQITANGITSPYPNVYPGIELYSARGTVSKNVISGLPTSAVQTVGIADAAPDVTVSGNTLENLYTGIALTADGAVVKSNTISMVNYPGINFNCHTGTVSGNILNGAWLLNVPATFSGVNSIFNAAQIEFGGC